MNETQFHKKEDNVALRSDCMDAEVDLQLHFLHMSEELFLLDVAHTILALAITTFKYHNY